MDRIISLLLFAGFFYLMMRFGCGAHMVHGHHHDRRQGTGPAAGRSSKDPVCGMEVEPGRGYSEVFAGHEYRFCSRKCLDKFDATPAQFARA
jgi:YHS domain-containing protein